jgi:predicted nucleic acid-binding protein
VSKLIAVLDACVIYPTYIRDLLMHLAVTNNLFQARWTDEIHNEWIRNLLKNNSKITKESLQKTRNTMDNAIRDCLIVGYHDLIPSLTLPDDEDRHVLAAAISGKANIIVTFNLKDFPSSTLKNYGIEAQHPDDFILNLIDLDYESVCEAVNRNRMMLKNPPMNIEELLETYRNRGIPKTVAKLQLYHKLL